MANITLRSLANSEPNQAVGSGVAALGASAGLHRTLVSHQVEGPPRSLKASYPAAVTSTSDNQQNLGPNSVPLPGPSNLTKPNWQTTEAYAFCRELHNMLIQVLPGYDPAPWGITRTTVPAAYRRSA